MANDAAGLLAYLETALDDTTNVVWSEAELNNIVAWAVADIYPRFGRILDPTITFVDLVEDTYFYSLPSGVAEVSRVDWFEHGAVLTTLSAAADDIVDTTTEHDFTAGQRVRFTSLTGGSGLTAGTIYYVISANLGDTTFQVSATEGGSAINFTTDITAGTVELVGGDEHGPLAGGLWNLQGDPWGTQKIRVAPGIVDQGGTLRIHGYGRYDVTTNLIPDHLVPLVLAMSRVEAYRRVAGERSRFEQWMVARPKQGVSLNDLLNLVAEARSEVAEHMARRFRTWRMPVPGRLG